MRYAVVLCDPYSTDEIHGLIGPFEDRGQAEAHLTGLLGQGLNPDSLAHVQDDRRGYPTTTGIIAIYDPVGDRERFLADWKHHIWTEGDQ